MTAAVRPCVAQLLPGGTVLEARDGALRPAPEDLVDLVRLDDWHVVRTPWQVASTELPTSLCATSTGPSVPTGVTGRPGASFVLQRHDTD